MKMGENNRRMRKNETGKKKKEEEQKKKKKMRKCLSPAHLRLKVWLHPSIEILKDKI